MEVNNGQVKDVTGSTEGRGGGGQTSDGTLESPHSGKRQDREATERRKETIRTKQCPLGKTERGNHLEKAEELERNSAKARRSSKEPKISLSSRYFEAFLNLILAMSCNGQSSRTCLSVCSGAPSHWHPSSSEGTHVHREWVGV